MYVFGDIGFMDLWIVVSECIWRWCSILLLYYLRLLLLLVVVGRK